MADANQKLDAFATSEADLNWDELPLLSIATTKDLKWVADCLTEEEE